MGLKGTALAIGVGYVLGARAGEQRYAELKEFWDRTGGSLVETPSVQRLGQASKDAGNRALELVATRAQTSAERVFSSVRDSGGRRFVATVRERGQVE